MLVADLKKREFIKKMTILGATPLLLPGCSWFFSSDDGTSLSSKFIVIGKKQNDGPYEILNVTKNKIKSLAQLPKGFSPAKVVWSKDGKGLISGFNSQIVMVIDRAGKVISTEKLSDEYVYGPSVYWESKDQFVTAQVNQGAVSKMDETIKLDKVKPKPQLVFRSAQDGKEVGRFAMEQSINVAAMSLSGDDVVVLESAINPNKKPAQIMKYSLSGKHFVFKMLINPPYQPSVIHVVDKKCYIGLEFRADDGTYRAAPILFFDMKANKQKFLTSKSNRVSGGMIKTSSVTASSDNKLIGFCHEEGRQLTFWSNEDQKFYGMLKLEQKPQFISPTSKPNEFIVGLKGSKAQLIHVGFDEITVTQFSQTSMAQVSHIQGS